ncbi:MAG: type 4a pilus biogenesis protein PilO [Deltaproteobacteria bacterium]|nr:type 4a pilus biogenesis protein PilO [Deltaproteobacteria bacterium]
MIKISVKTLDRIGILLIIALTFTCGYWVIKDSVAKHKQIHQENDIVTKSLNQLRSTEDNFKNINSLMVQTKNELEFLNKRIPKSVNIGEVLKEIDSFMKKRKITLISMQPMASVEEKIYTKIPIKLMLKGSFINIYNLLYDFETMNRMLVTENMTISRTNFAEDCQAELTANVYQRE